MKRPAFLAAVALAALSGCAAVAIEDNQIGLRKASVFDVVKPTPFDFDSPGAAITIAPTPGSGRPPMISHAVEEYLPITASANECRDCHDKPASIGKVKTAGKATPAPASHYAARDGVPLALAARQYNCTSCHAPQAEVAPLVRNTSL